MRTNEAYRPEAGALVMAQVKTGEYIGEVVEVNGPRALVKILAVVKHPEQGDLHNPYNPDVPFFHERRALSYTEKTNVLAGDIRPYAGSVPDYKESLTLALAREIEGLDRLKRWAERGLELLEQLGKEYR
ncbi:kinase-associated protein B [Paenibacillus phyllosphaerae]|uniref:Kinase-associated protein B n=1 Tax=Paenibacillus phyllosphaerae TaxID=274593 RepID=A0A7W5FKX8_9BACL|nr:kinase-associated lipoprotein B [Paenibacillus phyllosphaerae]MBB3108581.1 kinase-associated protein B [Paenibacillus phyllosphaerae]